MNPFKVDPTTGKKLRGEMQQISQSIDWVEPTEIKTIPKTQISDASALSNLEMCKVKDAASDGVVLSNVQKHFVSGFGLYAERAPLKRNPVIQFVTVDFPDLAGKRSPKEDLKPVTDFLGKYWKAQTTNGTELEFRIPNAYIRMPKTVVDYELNVDFFSGKWKNTTSFDYVRAAVQTADSQINFSDVDVMVIAVPAEVTRQQIAAFVAESSEKDRGQGFDTVEKRIYNTLIMAGPTGHNFGLTDIRNTLNVSAQDSSDLGIYDLMNSSIAPELLAWNRFILGVLNDDQVRCVTSGTSTHLIKPVEMNTKDSKLVVIPTGKYQAIAIESRRAIGFDAAMGTLSEGVIVYTIDTTIPYNLSPMKLVPRIGSTDTQWRRDSALKLNDSVTVQGWKITVVESGDYGDVVKVEKAS
jgi:M6 family metalloprotease-like protein